MNGVGPGIWSWLVPLAAGAAILALYFLKTRRRPVLVPSTLLWRRTIEDRRVNALWQRLRRSVMLLLQLLAVAAAAIALFRPAWEGSALVGGRYVFVIDASASMSTADVAPSRLEEAKRRALALIDKMSSGDTAMVVSFAARARIEQSFTDNREPLRRAVRAIAPTDATTSLDEALRLCAGGALAKPLDNDEQTTPSEAERAAQVFVFSDGNFPQVNDDVLARLPIVFVPIGKAQTDNLAITRLAVGRSVESPRKAQALARIHNFSAAPHEVDVELYVEDQLADARRVTLAEAAPHDLVFSVDDAADGVWEVRLVGNRDALPLDDRAWAVLEPPTPTRLMVVTSGNRYLSSALATDEARVWCNATFVKPDYLTSEAYRTAADGGLFDVIVFDRCRPAAMPDCSTVFFAALPPGDDWRFDAAVAAPLPFDTAQAHPLMQNVTLGEVLVAEATPPVGPSGSQSLVDSARGPLVVSAGRGGFEDVVFGFALVDGDGVPQTNWPLVDGAGFEQFVLNTAQYFGRGRLGDERAMVRVGDPVRVGVESSATDLIVERPDGSRTSLAAGRGEPMFYETNRLGPYRVWQGSQVRQRWAVNLFDSIESNPAVASSPKLQVGHEEIIGQAKWETARWEGWKPFLLLVLALLGIEWYMYGNRAGL